MAVDGPDSSVILRYIRDAVSEEERAQVDGWLEEDPEHEQVLLQIAGIYHARRTRERIASRDSLRAYREVEKKIRARAGRFLLKRVSLYAACFLFGLFVSSVFYWQKQEPGSAGPQKVTLQANAGMRARFSLPDGTVAYLNSGSTLSYPQPYSKEERRVELKGEAYFEVAHNPDQPFIVSVQEDRLRVKVLGTVFNVQAYEGDKTIQTTLVSGAVSLELKDQEGKVSEQKVFPSEKAIYNLDDNTLDVKTVDVENEIGWKDGRLAFKETPLPEVLKRLSDFYHVDFKVKDPKINSYRFTGTFVDRPLSQILDYLRISSHIDYSIHRHPSEDRHPEHRLSVELQVKE